MSALKEIPAAAALNYYCRLPGAQQIGTLSPQYVVADAVRDPSLKPFFLIYEEGDYFWLLGAHLANVPNSEFLAVSSPYGYGGPVANTLDPEFAERAWAAYRAWCWERLVLAEVMKLHPLAYHPYGGEVKFNRWVYNCGTKYSPKCRNKVGKARGHNLTVTQVNTDVIWRNFPKDYREAMEDLKAEEFYFFSDEYFKALSEIDGVCLIVCEEDEAWRSASVMLAGSETMESHLTITNERGRKIGATNYLVHTMRQTLREECPLFLGGGKTTKDNDALAVFKRSFGGEKMRFNIGWKIHRPEVYNEMKQGIETDRILFWRH